MSDEVKKEVQELATEKQIKDAERVIKTVEIAKKLTEAGIPKIQGDPRPFASLMSDDRQLKAVFEAIEAAIWRSFAEDIREDPFRPCKPTMDDVKHRFKICEMWFRRARADLHYSVEQSLDMLGQALRAALKGVPFNPPVAGSRIWTPT